MAKKKYVALHTVYYNDGTGAQAVATARNVAAGNLGLFSAEFTEKQEKELIALGSIRVAVKSDAEDANDALDHDGDGEPGGSVDELDQMKVDELKEVAERESVDLTDITKKADIIAAIRAGRENLLG